MAITGSAAASSAAPWVVLVGLIRLTGIQTKRACDLSGLAATHSAAQCGHCGSKKT
jgi:hypothetical protein